MIRALAVALGVLMLMLVAVTPAVAHPYLLVTSPEADTAVTASPPAVTLVFSEPVTLGPRAVRVLDAAEKSYPTDPPVPVRDGRGVTARLPQLDL